MNGIDLQGEVAVVTGGAQGLGLAMARRLLASRACEPLVEEIDGPVPFDVPRLARA